VQRTMYTTAQSTADSFLDTARHAASLLLYEAQDGALGCWAELSYCGGPRFAVFHTLAFHTLAFFLARIVEVSFTSAESSSVEEEASSIRDSVPAATVACILAAAKLDRVAAATMAQPKLKLYTYPGNKNAYKALIAAEYVGAKIDVPSDFQMGTDNKKPEFLKLNPNGKVGL